MVEPVRGSPDAGKSPRRQRNQVQSVIASQEYESGAYRGRGEETNQMESYLESGKAQGRLSGITSQQDFQIAMGLN